MQFITEKLALRDRLSLVLMVLVMASLLWGCANRKFVQEQIQESETRTTTQLIDLREVVNEWRADFRKKADELGLKIEILEETTTEIDETSKENAAKIKQLGQILFKKTLADSEMGFSSSDSNLSDAAKSELDKLVNLLYDRNQLVYLEIQGHTDSSGQRTFNMELGEKRALAVHNYLYHQHDFPLHLMNIISYGPDKPITENDTADGRSQNRRVVLLVRVQMKNPYAQSVQ